MRWARLSHFSSILAVWMIRELQFHCLFTDIVEIKLPWRLIMMFLRHQELLQKGGLRKASYRCFTAWVYGYLGSGIRKPIPACAVKAIRSAFPDPKGKYIGFLSVCDYAAEDMIFE
ncbi:uncharacterized protein LOC116411082 isoform X2 [Xenopus tropicalis]|uniref:Uncharacterized protein LOC116411082 isoform X2 n=1 Tax=Xenopus tropicalis TaxID=8364 RepID=A0A8J1JQF0_XENTR|nr:uncharacterized protein LOC116411082 isoform X2 [Xenopus tropicalis]|eukprot:XP_012809802.1 PREDICTED: uncharacterized protein LOC100495921 isoform X2 [Xenopus tropicalis]